MEKYIVISKSGLILRNNKNKKGLKIVNIPYLQPVNVIEKSDVSENIDGTLAAWWKVKWLNYEGFVFSGYLAKKESDYIENYKKNIAFLIPETIETKYLKDFEINSPIDIQNGQLATFILFEKKNIKIIHLPIQNSQFIRDEFYGDALFGNGFKVNPDQTWSRYKITFQENTLKTYLNNKNIKEIESLILYPPLEKVNCLQNKDIIDFPIRENLINLAYALDIDQDNKPDILFFIAPSYYQGYIKKENKWSNVYSLNSKSAESDTALEYYCP
ncbi:SH3 domain-containing protein [Leptospira mtsangambouensis]|uniref:SH3 domain-containing protein n=1 Tax=Leptospira mtsangambouensis TaxID=2484912 RepID=UPI001EE9D4E0|nr:SH3 domain-containing protein [Leptospira mtsangambouensis]MCG6142757.1 hypothetical protein [Leptospira mtsangambouensis]